MMIFATSCDKADIQKSLPNDSAKITTRSDDCENCPAEDCCCRIVSQSGTTNLTFCGTTNPEWSTFECTVDLEDPCPDIIGYYWFASLSGTGDDEFFCVAKNSSFMVGVASASSLTISCQVGQTSPQIVNLTPTAGEKFYFTVDESCELSTCHPSG